MTQAPSACALIRCVTQIGFDRLIVRPHTLAGAWPLEGELQWFPLLQQSPKGGLTAQTAERRWRISDDFWLARDTGRHTGVDLVGSSIRFAFDPTCTWLIKLATALRGSRGRCLELSTAFGLLRLAHCSTVSVSEFLKQLDLRDWYPTEAGSIWFRRHADRMGEALILPDFLWSYGATLSERGLSTGPHCHVETALHPDFAEQGYATPYSRTYQEVIQRWWYHPYRWSPERESRIEGEQR